MPFDAEGRKTVGMITRTQFLDDPSRNIHPGALIGELQSIRVNPGPAALDVVDFLGKEAPPPPPTMEQLRARDEVTKYDVIGSIKGSGTPMSSWVPDLDEWLRTSPLNVQAQGLTHKYAPRKPPRPLLHAHAIHGQVDEDVAKAAAATVARIEQEERGTTGVDKFLHGMVAMSKHKERRLSFLDPSHSHEQLNVNDWVSTSVFKVDEQHAAEKRRREAEDRLVLAQARRKQVEEEEAKARMLEEQRAADRVCDTRQRRGKNDRKRRKKSTLVCLRVRKPRPTASSSCTRNRRLLGSTRHVPRQRNERSAQKWRDVLQNVKKCFACSQSNGVT